jgi:ribosomal protein S18 acetylase RimI-like enzyme
VLPGVAHITRSACGIASPIPRRRDARGPDDLRALGRRHADVAIVTPELTVREATTHDIEDCIALADLVADGSSVEWSELFRHNIEHCDRYLAVTQAGDEVIGYGRTAWFEPDPGAPANAAPAGYYLVGLVVDRSWRRRGVASAIISARLAWVAQRASEAWYGADVRNRVSIQLHERAGFMTVTDDVWFPTVTDGGGSHLLGRVTLPPG